MNSTVTKEQQRQEAIERLRILEGKGLMPEVRRDFERGKINYSERVSFPGLGANGILYWLEGNPELEKVVRDFEESTGSLAYHATHETFEFGEVIDIFHVSKYEEEWLSAGPRGLGGRLQPRIRRQPHRRLAERTRQHRLRGSRRRIDPKRLAIQNPNARPAPPAQARAFPRLPSSEVCSCCVRSDSRTLRGGLEGTCTRAKDNEERSAA